MACQSIYYCYSEKKYWLRDDKLGWNDFIYNPTKYYPDPNGQLYALDGRKVSPIPKHHKIDYKDPDVYEKDISKELIILRDLYFKTDNIPEWHNIIYVDIEIEIGGDLTPQYIREAKMPFTSISLIDVNLKQKICFVIDKSRKIQEINQDGKIIIPCYDEEDLIHKFLNKWQEIDPTIVVGWNSQYFDIPYIYYRIKRILGNKVYDLSPIKKISVKEADDNNILQIGGINCLDYMLLVKKYIMKEESSYKLGDIGEKYVNLGKIEYEGNLDQLFKDDVNKYIEYNIRDVEIIEALENKLQFIQLTILISHLCHTPYESIFWNTVLNEGAILTYLKRKNIVSINKPTTQNPLIKQFSIGEEVKTSKGYTLSEGIVESINKDLIGIRTKSGVLKYYPPVALKKSQSYAGGYLKDPKPGIYELACDLDFTSLYPSIIKSLNLGIETLVGSIKNINNYEQNNSLEKLKLKDPNETIIIEKLNKQTYIISEHEVTIGKLIKIIEDNNFTLSASGAFYRTDVKSICCEVLEDWFNQRNKYKKLKKEAGKTEDWEKYKLYDLYQLAFKILQNALYGTFAINGWRYTDGFKICSSAITNSGQRLTRESINIINNKINEELNTKDDYIIASDTDSLFIQLKQITKHRFPDLNLEYSNKEKRNPIVLKIIDELQETANTSLNKISTDLFNVKGKHYFELKQEVILEGAYWSGKRRYAMFVTNKEGVDIEEWDFKGLDVMKSNFPKLFKDFGEKIIKDIILKTKKEILDKEVLDFKKSLKEINWKKLIKPTGVKNLNNYIKAKPLSGEIFSKLHKKCPINTKSALITNDILRFKKIDKKYPLFQAGDKIFTVPLKPNPYNINTIGVKGYNDPEEIEKIIILYINREEIFNSVIKNKIEKIYNDIGWGAPIFNNNINRYFDFL